MEMGLYQQQTLKLVMTQELRQAISLLQFSTIELSEFLEEQALENPLIDIEDPGTHMKEEMRYDMPVMWQDEPTHELQGHEEQENVSPFDRIKDDRERVSDHLINQIRLTTTGDEQLILTHMARNIGDDGYLAGTYEELTALFNLTESEYEAYVAKIQSFEPAGIGARSLQECLLLQLRRYYPREKLAAIIVEFHLEELAARKWKELSKSLNVPLKDIQHVCDLVQKLDPHPGTCFGNEHPGHLVPDVYVEKEGGRFIVRLNDDGLPRIRLNRQYRHLLENKEAGEAALYAQKKYKQLVWLLKSIDQRQQTIRNITEAIVQFQNDFFEKGPSEMKPLTLKDVAEAADVHESTVSRTTNQKYVQTPHGLFELKYFFSLGMSTNTGEQTSTFVIKSKIKELVDNENKKKPLSDQKIVDYLEEEHGIAISRRAIAKYRGELQIPSSSKRKRYE
ncbi:RNA polymerase factor sigma-54 [Bacillus piscicola]|uniref:RNA polymerase factor sigma-54 n=1 Tax=Bacillus piscicola TaxID=1632684 RepID=UPI001F094EB7|nr:RNA polymerase factor sigma-54 [Bacillus piscicola]